MEITVKVNYKNEKLQKSECIRNTNRATGI